MFEVEKGVPAPKPGATGRSIYPWPQMEPGDSVQVPEHDWTKVCQSVYIYRHRNPETVWTVSRSQQRIWRVK
jgi:hypothetical protein